MKPFIYTALPARIVFDAPVVTALRQEIEGLGCRRALLLSTPWQARAISGLADDIGNLAAGVFDQAEMHTPVAVTEAAIRVANEVRADCLVAVGGGSTIGLGKAMALRTDLPQIAVPTTYAGSEVTPIIGQTEAGRKTTQRTLKVLPEVVIYDVDLTLTLPVQLSVTSGMNAVAHAVEALYAQEANPVVTLLAERGITALIRALPLLVQAPSDRNARAEALFGAWACGTCLGAVGMSLHHKLCHVLGGSFALPHSETHTIILPHAAAALLPGVPGAAAILARAMGSDDPAGTLYDIPARLGAAMALREIGMPHDGLRQAAQEVTQSAYWLPVEMPQARVLSLLEEAWHGRRPQAVCV
ncbi:maleylacetate reductase [Xanthobacter autotrophicus]|uniref:maleylacetate reductase n=1 Tax=Xanthobacter autotrophicus TaxID=280 RepID=UPI0024A75D06|nr:maleylacetate reductase [Xanthobacter autotrophicus]MDI4655312.1 maleylacetate reductase [Xanthobacter autotrophicus]